MNSYLTTASASTTYATKTELVDKADVEDIPQGNQLMAGQAPTVADISAETVTDIPGLISAINAILAQLRTRNVIE